MKRLNLFLSAMWQPLIALVVAVVGLLFVLVYRLGSLVPGLSSNEVVQFHNVSSFGQIIQNPVNAPYNLLYLGINSWAPQSNATLRLASVVFGLVLIVSFFLILKHWYGLRVAVLTTILMASSSWFLHNARYGTTAIAITLILALFAAASWLRNTSSRWALLVCALLSGGLLFIPGAIWFVVLGAIWQRKFLFRALKKISTPVIVSCSTILVLITAIFVWQCVLRPFLIKSFLGLPEKLPTISNFIANAWQVPIQIFVRSSLSPEQWLSPTPLITVFATVMFIIGIYVLITQHSLDRTKVILGGLLISWLLVSLQGNFVIVTLLPFIYLTIAAGLSFMLKEWFLIFPRNPLARSFGIALITIAVVVASLYGLNRYFMAWPHAISTTSVFQSSI